MTPTGRVAAATRRVLILVLAAAAENTPALAAEPPTATAASADGARVLGAPEVPPAPPARGRDVVEMTVVGPVGDYARLIAPIGARTPGGVPLLWNRIDRFNPLAELLRTEPAPAPVALRCWIDLSDLRRATLYFASRGGERFLVRELALSGRLDEVDQQSLAQVLEISITALLENQENGLTRAEARAVLARAQAPAVVAAPHAERAWAWGLSASYAVEAIAASVPIGQGPGAMLSLWSSPGLQALVPDAGSDSPDDMPPRRAHALTTGGPHLGVWLAGHYRMPSTAHSPEIAARFEALAARAGVAAGWGRLSARVGGGADWTHVTPQAAGGGANVMLAVPHWSTTWVVSSAVAALLPIDRIAGLERFALSLVLSLDALPAATEFALGDGTGSRVAFALRRARPAAALEIGFY